MVWSTHRVSNQSPELVDINLYDSDVVLQQGVRTLSGDRFQEDLQRYGRLMGSTHVRQLAEQANRCSPAARIWDARGHRIDQVDFHPAWHSLMSIGYSYGLHCRAWSGQPHAHLGRAAHYLLHGQAEAGTLCPMTMTSAAIPLLRADSRLGDFVHKLECRDYDERDMAWTDKTAAMAGMGLTEKQGGSDLRGTRTRALRSDQGVAAVADGSASPHYLLTGHKWFYSSPTSDAHLVLASHNGVLSCFFVPRYRADGSRNAVHIQRLKDKVGNRSNASAEVEFQDATAILLGEPGRGLAQLLEMAAYTRLDCVLGSAALLRQAVVQAIHHARHRRAFGRPLVQQPLMQTVLADLALESEAATTLALHLAHAFDEQPQSARARAWCRILVPAAKFWVCKRAIHSVGECMEVLGGNGYVETGPLARLYREAPVNSIWEGSGNIMCLDVLRALSREPELVAALFNDLSDACADDMVLSAQLTDLVELVDMDDEHRQAVARRLCGLLVLLAQAVLLRRFAPDYVADAFVMTRFGWRPGTIGDTIAGNSAVQLLERSWMPDVHL